MEDGLTALPLGLRLRPVADGDRELLLGLFASTREDELRVVPWSDAEKAEFIRMQFDAQDVAYRQAYPDGEFLVVESGGPIGRLYLGRPEGELRIVEVTLAPEHRGQGIGSALMAWVLDRADAEGRVASLHVEPWNPARRLYLRLGFEPVEVNGIYELMRRPVPQLNTAS